MTTWRVVKEICPLDITEVTGYVPGSNTTSGCTPDFRPLFGMDWFLESYIMCPTCGFTAPYKAFEHPEGLDREKVLQALRDVRTKGLFRKWDCAIAVATHWHNNAAVVAHLAMGAKWLADDTGDPALIRERLDLAIEAQKPVLAREGLKDGDRKTYSYLVGELLRQKGEREEAVKWFDKALAMEGEMLKDLARQQRLAAMYEGAPVEQLLAAVQKGTPDEQVKAIGMLRDVDDEKAFAFLKEVVLHCPEDLREQAMHELIGERPRRYHLPIYLEAIGSDHFRTVQGGALAVEILRAKEAAPFLLKALEHSVSCADYLLGKALAVVATENEVEGLSRLVNVYRTKESRIDRMRALLNTHSEKAIPPLARLLTRAPDLIRSAGYDSDIAESATVFGPGLLAKLADEAGPQCASTLRALRKIAEAKLAALPEGAVYIPKDSDMGLQRSLEEARAQLERMAPEERESSAAADSLARLENSEYCKSWRLAELGMTGDRRARGVLLEYLKSRDEQVRAEAIKSLSCLYDKEIGDLLAARLPDESPIVQTVIVRKMGETGDADHVDALLALARQPTLVRTKRVWIRTMEQLAPERAGPVLQYWATSPDKGLAQAARGALAHRKAGMPAGETPQPGAGGSP